MNNDYQQNMLINIRFRFIERKNEIHVKQEQRRLRERRQWHAHQTWRMPKQYIANSKPHCWRRDSLR